MQMQKDQGRERPEGRPWSEGSEEEEEAAGFGRHQGGQVPLPFTMGAFPSFGPSVSSVPRTLHAAYLSEDSVLFPQLPPPP